MLSTKDVKAGSEGGGGGAKTIQPGNHRLKINSIELKQWPFMKEKNAYHLILNVETEPIKDFEGFFIDPQDESKGRYAGQVGQVKTNRYYYADGTTKGGTPVYRDPEILKMLKSLCNYLDMNDWFLSVDNKYETIEEFVEALNTDAPFAGKFAEFCVAGKEYYRNNGYLGYDMYLPKPKGALLPIAFKANDKVIPYSEAAHLVKAEPKEVNSFGGGDDFSSGSDVSGSTEFEL
jgi:hypothetical protein